MYGRQYINPHFEVFLTKVILYPIYIIAVLIYNTQFFALFALGTVRNAKILHV